MTRVTGWNCVMRPKECPGVHDIHTSEDACANGLLWREARGLRANDHPATTSARRNRRGVERRKVRTWNELYAPRATSFR